MINATVPGSVLRDAAEAKEARGVSRGQLLVDGLSKHGDQPAKALMGLELPTDSRKPTQLYMRDEHRKIVEDMASRSDQSRSEIISRLLHLATR